MKVYIQHLIAILSFLLYFAAGTVSAYPDNDHQITVKGVVLDKTSQPIPGVVVMVKNNQSAGGTITDLDGKFWFNVPVNSVVVFSCMGYETVEKHAIQASTWTIRLSEDAELLAVTEMGYGKRTDISEYRTQTRGGVGIRTYKCSDVTGKVVGIKAVKDSDDIIMITSEGIVIRIAATDVSSIGRSTKGVRLMRLSDDVKVVSVALTEHEEEVEEEEGEVVAEAGEEKPAAEATEE